MAKKRNRKPFFLAAAACGAVAVLGAGAWWYAQEHARPAVREKPQAIENQYELTANDSGKMFAYPVTSRFSVFLDEAHYPKQKLRCSPGGIVGQISNVPVVPPPLYVVRYEAVSTGTCVLQDGDFSATIVVYSLE